MARDAPASSGPDHDGPVRRRPSTLTRTPILRSNRPEELPIVPDEPSGIGPDRAVLHHRDGDTAVLRVGAAMTEVHLPSDHVPEDVTVGTWLILDLQLSPPLVIGVDHQLTDRRRGAGG
jgi:hypothetical protein